MIPSLALAWRNLWRNSSRSLLSAAAVTVVVTITLTFFSLTGAARNGIYYSVTRLAGHLQLRVANAEQVRSFDDSLLPAIDLSALQNQLPESEMVRVLALPVLIESDGRSYGVLLQGLELPETVRERYRTEYLLAGEALLNDDLEGIALGEKLAQNLKVGLGDTVYLYAPGTSGYGAGAFVVRGILKLPSSEMMAISSLVAAQDLAAPAGINRIEITFPDFSRSADDGKLAEIKTGLQAAIGEGISVESWSEVNPDMAGFIVYFRRVSFIIALIFFILAGLLVANTVYLSVIERVREFGLLRALGTPQPSIILMVLFESVLLCFLGAVLGLIIGSMIVSLLARGISFPASVADFLAEQGLPRIFYGSISSREILLTVAFTFVTASLSALLPALTAARLEPVEAMRFTA
jgi:ABC-type lipoprotein release transport system permease subunit